MRALPLTIGPLHFVGIGGIGMSGIAEVLHNLGYQVQGSDVADGANVRRLTALGIPVAIGHDAANLGMAEVVVISSAVQPDNPEIGAARTRRLPVVRRAEMLAELMRLKWSLAIAGTHGKTTTTSLVGALLETAQLDPTVINGGIINAYGTNTRLGAGDWMVVEADESDGTFTRLPATGAIVTNIDPEHLDFYGGFDALRQAFETFVGNIPFYGFAVLCIDHPVVQGMIPKLSDRRVLTYGMSPQADIRAVDLRLGRDGAHYDIVVSDGLAERGRTIPDLFLPMFGRHNVQNSLAAAAVGEALGLGDDALHSALRNFKGVEAAVHQDRRVEWGDRDRRLRPSSGRDRGGAEGGARDRLGQGRRRGAAASLQPRLASVRRLLHLLQRCRHRVRRRHLCRRRGGDRGRDARGDRRRPDRARPSQRPRPRRPGRARGPGRRAGAARRHGRLPRRRLDYRLGQQPAGRARRLGKTEPERMIGPQPDLVPVPAAALAAVRGRLIANAPIGRQTWFGAGGAAAMLFRPADRDDLAAFLATLPPEVPVTVIGGGSNLLIRDGGVPGVAIRLGRGFAGLGIDGSDLVAGAGALHLNVALRAAEAGIAGLEFLSGIPGTIGGGVRMNAGAYGGEIRDVLVQATALDRSGAAACDRGCGDGVFVPPL